MTHVVANRLTCSSGALLSTKIYFSLHLRSAALSPGPGTGSAALSPGTGTGASILAGFRFLAPRKGGEGLYPATIVASGPNYC